MVLPPTDFRLCVTRSQEDGEDAWMTGALGRLPGGDVVEPCNFTVDGLWPDSDLSVRVLLLDKDMHGVVTVPFVHVHTLGQREFNLRLSLNIEVRSNMKITSAQEQISRVVHLQWGASRLVHRFSPLRSNVFKSAVQFCGLGAGLVSNLTLSDVTARSVRVTWDSPLGEEVFSVRYQVSVGVCPETLRGPCSCFPLSGNVLRHS